MYFSQLKKLLSAKGRLGPVYVCYGNNAFEVDEAVDALKARAGRDGDPGLSIVEPEKDQRDLGTVMDALQNVPMFVEYTMVVVRDAGDFINRHRKALEAYLGNPSPTGVLVMTPARWNRSTKLAKRVEALRGDVACWLPRSDDEILDWVQRRGRSAHGKRLDASAARLLLDLCQGDLGGLSAELKKLALYVGSAAAITEADVAAAAMSYASYRPFDLCDKLAAGDRHGAMAVVEALIAEGVPVVVLVGTLRSHFRRLLEAKALSETDGEAAAVSRLGGHPKQREGFRRQLQRFSMDHLVASYRHLLDGDLAVKTSRFPGRLIAERLVLALMAGKAAAPRV